MDHPRSRGVSQCTALRFPRQLQLQRVPKHLQAKYGAGRANTSAPIYDCHHRQVECGAALQHWSAQVHRSTIAKSCSCGAGSRAPASPERAPPTIPLVLASVPGKSLDKIKLWTKLSAIEFSEVVQPTGHFVQEFHFGEDPEFEQFNSVFSLSQNHNLFCSNCKYYILLPKREKLVVLLLGL